MVRRRRRWKEEGAKIKIKKNERLERREKRESGREEEDDYCNNGAMAHGGLLVDGGRRGSRRQWCSPETVMVMLSLLFSSSF